MHPLLVLKICESVQRRVRQGDCPTEPPQSLETLEEAVLELWAQTQRLRIRLDPNDEPDAGSSSEY